MLLKNLKFCNVRNIHNLHISQMNCIDIYIYKPIAPRTEDDCEVVTAEDVMRQLDWSEEGDEIVVHVNCPGGNYHEGIAIFNALNACPKRVVVKIEGIAASMASIIILAADEIVISPFARIMTHRVSGVSRGNAAQMRDDAAGIETFEATLLEIYSRRTGLTPEECRTKFLADTDTWFTADEAVAAKLADRIEEGKLQIGIKTMNSTSMQDAAAFYQSCAAILTVPNSTKDMDFLKVKNQLHLEADVTEEAFLNQVEDWRTKATQVDALTAKLEGYETANALAESTRITGIIEKAVTEKRITAIAIPVWENLFAINPDNALKALMAIAPAKDLTNLGAGGNADERAKFEAMNFKQLDRGGHLERVRAEYKDLYEVKFEEAFGKKP